MPGIKELNDCLFALVYSLFLNLFKTCFSGTSRVVFLPLDRAIAQVMGREAQASHFLVLVTPTSHRIKR